MEVYGDRRGNAPVAAYLQRLRAVRPAEAASILRYIDLLAEKGERLRMPYATMIDKELRLYELRPGNHRVAYALHHGDYVILHAWRKTTQKLDQREASTARKRLLDWRERHPEETRRR